MEKERESKIDFLRGMAMIAVVVGHAICSYDYLAIPFNFIYSIHMPLLFFISGYLVERNTEQRQSAINKTFILKKTVALIFPFFSWTVIVPWILGGYKASELRSLLRNVSGIDGNGIWFLPVLFGLNMMYYAWLKIRFENADENMWKGLLKAFVVECIVLVLYIFTRYPYFLNMLSYFIPYFLGVFLYKYEMTKKILDNDKVRTLSIMGYCLLFQYFDFNVVSPYTQMKRIILATFGIVVLWKVADSIRCEASYNKLVIVFGQNSLAIYLMHSYMSEWVKTLGRVHDSIFAMLLAVLGSIVVCVVCVICAKVIETSRLLRLGLLGKYK